MSKNTVVITDLRSKEAKDAAKYLSDRYNVLTVPEEICLWDEEALRAWAEPFKTEIVGMIHPAPEMIFGGIEDITPEMWDQNANEGPVAALIVTKVFGMILRENGGGAIIYLNSIHAEKPTGSAMLYSMTCGATQMLCRDFAQDYGCFHVRPYFVMRAPVDPDSPAKNHFTPIYYGIDMRYAERKIPAEGYLNGILEFLLTDAAAPLLGTDIRAEGGFTGFYNGHRFRAEGGEYIERRK